MERLFLVGARALPSYYLEGEGLLRYLRTQTRPLVGGVVLTDPKHVQTAPEVTNQSCRGVHLNCTCLAVSRCCGL